jgi:predicted TIM-barrel fold metal-dependent hydrolase
MPELSPAKADAHIHLFDGGYQHAFTGRPGVRVDEAACYASLMRDHNIQAALVVGYAAEPWCTDNNAHLAKMAAAHNWVYPAAFVTLDRPPPTVYDLDRLRDERFAGLSFYVFGDASREALVRLPDELWRWLSQRRWLISVNSRGPDWRGWLPILQKHRDLRVLVSHLGLPPRQREAPAPQNSRELMADVLALAQFPQVHVKLSGFYALSDPGHEYPHRAAWPYVEQLVETFTPRRLLWASDYSPCLGWISFPQTLSVLDVMPFFNGDDRRLICGENLRGLFS